MTAQTEAMRLALELKNSASAYWTEKEISIIEELIELLAQTEQPAQQGFVVAIRALTDQCFSLIQERDELQKQVWRYEKNGVTCQTYRHKVDASCAECNVHEIYTSPSAQLEQKPIAWMYDWVDNNESLQGWIAHKESEIPKLLATNIRPLYTKRTWVGLTEKDYE